MGLGNQEQWDGVGPGHTMDAAVGQRVRQQSVWRVLGLGRGRDNRQDVEDCVRISEPRRCGPAGQFPLTVGRKSPASAS